MPTDTYAVVWDDEDPTDAKVKVVPYTSQGSILNLMFGRSEVWRVGTKEEMERFAAKVNGSKISLEKTVKLEKGA